MTTPSPTLRRALLCALALLSWSAASPAQDRPAEDAAAQRPRNVLLLMADDLCAGVLGSYGGDPATSPNLDRLAARGLRFTRAYSQYPVCGPSRAATLAGMYPQRLGIRGNRGARRIVAALEDRWSLPQWFREHDWFTARVSKIFHMRVPGDITKGVDGPDHPASWEMKVNCRAPEWHSAGEARALDTTRLRHEPDKHYNLGFGTAFYEVRVPGEGAEQADHQAATAAQRILAERAAEPEQPFFLAVGFVRPHVPLVAPVDSFARHDPDDVELPERIDDDWDDIPQAGRSLHSGRIGLAGQEGRQRDVIAAYRAATSFMDEQVGRVLAALDELDLASDTLVVFMSDHGYHLGEHQFWQKLSLHEESVRIPLLIAGPGVRPGTTDALVEQIDLYPTLARRCGLDVPDHVQGRDLGPVLADHDATVRRAVHAQTGKGHLLRTERWALLQWNDGSAELYDMRADPRQFHNLAGDPDHSEQLEELRARLVSRRVAIGAPDDD